jgi:hypothetical protein
MSPVRLGFRICEPAQQPGDPGEDCRPRALLPQEVLVSCPELSIGAIQAGGNEGGGRVVRVITLCPPRACRTTTPRRNATCAAVQVAT